MVDIVFKILVFIWFITLDVLTSTIRSGLGKTDEVLVRLIELDGMILTEVPV